MKETLLLTGATGYVASHAWVSLLQAGIDVVGLDNCCNSCGAVVERVGVITGKPATLVRGDVRDKALLDALFTRYRFTAVMHFAALKAVAESVRQPLAYYDNNVAGLLALCEAMQSAGVTQLVFSSSAAVYGQPRAVPVSEDSPLSATSPYGRSKLMCEQILRDLERAEPAWRIAYLRYFNPAGAHESGLLGEDPLGMPNNLMPCVAQVAGGALPKLTVYGGDYPTIDGTCVRDYVHVCDLATGHLAALRYLRERGCGLTANIGTGQGHSVLQVAAAYERASGRRIPYEIVPRRPGDVAANYADPQVASRMLGWRAQHTLARMCADSWRWQSRNPRGYIR